jgi:sigma-B regulation protein RsbU (phosphoserine phosphatase)
MSPRPSLLLPASAAEPEKETWRRTRDWFLRRWPGRLVLAALAVWLLGKTGVAVPRILAVPAWIVAQTFFVLVAWRLVRFLLRRWLWRIRTKLIVSYMFVAVVPLVLLTLFFALAGVLSSGVVASYMVTSEIGRRGEDLGRATNAIFNRLGAGGAGDAAAAELALAPLKKDYPGIAYTLVRDGHRVAASGTMPDRLPDWLREDSFTGLVRDGERLRLRAVARRGLSFLVVDVPPEQLVKDLDQRAGIRFIAAGGRVRTQGGGLNIEIDDRPSPKPSDAPRVRAGERPAENVKVDGMVFFATPEQTDWATGAKDSAGVAFQYKPLQLIKVLTPGKVDTASMLVTALGVVGIIFLVMYAVALLVGILLARSITRSVHALSRGTERLRQGRFDQPIPVRSRDQLGELAESFNLMSRDIQQLMRESAEKERLEEELRIARRIQMSLLPQDTVSVPHVTIAATCIPAAEVGGDYYDLLPLPGDRLAVLVADVSGKGTSAALYMAELKGLMLSLSRVHDSPARLLAEANRILTGDMDPRSFITMSYAVLDPRHRRMLYARAGHSPLLQRVAAGGATHLLAPQGLGLGLDAGENFERLLEEQEVPLVSGDAFVFFTDGISEAMNERGELFGEDRLRRVLEEDGAGSSEQVRERVLAEVRSFVGEAPQHDDMTMVVLRIE